MLSASLNKTFPSDEPCKLILKENNKVMAKHFVEYISGCRFVVRAFAHCAMGRRINPSLWTH